MHNTLEPQTAPRPVRSPKPPLARSDKASPPFMKLIDKRSQLLKLAKVRQATRWSGYKCIGDYHEEAYECDHVSPYSKTAGNLDADIMVVLQDSTTLRCWGIRRICRPIETLLG